MTHYRSNLIRLYILKISHWFMLVMPIVVLFYNDNGLGMEQVFILQAIYSLSIVVWEIPSGYFADVWGRKNTIVAGAILGFAGYATYSISYSFTGFLLAEVILGIGQSLISGADSALLYDSLLDVGKEKDYVKLEGRLISIGNFAEATAGVIGGLLAAWSLRYPYYGQTLFALIGIPAAITLVEPGVRRVKMGLGWKHIIDIVRFALFRNPRLRWNIIYSSVVGASTLTMAWFVQPWLIRAGMPVSLFGVTWTILNLSVGIAAMYAYRIDHRLGKLANAAMFTGMLAMGFLLSGWIESLWGIVFILLFYLARGIATPVLKDNINRITPSEMRATVLSVRNFVIRVIFALWGPLYGWATDKYSLTAALTIAGIVFVALAGLSFHFFRRSGNLKEADELD